MENKDLYHEFVEDGEILEQEKSDQEFGDLIEHEHLYMQNVAENDEHVIERILHDMWFREIK